MPRLSLFVLTLSACMPGGLQPHDDRLDAYADNLFATGSDAEHALAEQIAWEHLHANAGRVLAGVDAVWTHSVAVDDLSTAHVRVTQTVDGVPVFGGEAIVHLLPNGLVSTLTDQLVRDIAVDTSPLYTGDEALELAAGHVGGWGRVTNLPTATLMVLRGPVVDHLVYRVDLDQLDGSEHTAMPRVFVDAHTGEVVWKYDDLQTIDGSASTAYNGEISFPVAAVGGGYALRGGGVGTYTFSNTEPWWSSINASHLSDVTSAATAFTHDDAAVDAHFGAHRTRDYFAQEHNRNGINGSGGPTLKDGVISSGVHYGNRYNNAFWNGQAMVYGDGDGNTFGPLTSLDIAAHEMTHGVTQFSAGLIYQGESGALNESMSDVFAVLVEAWTDGEGPDIWKIGEDCYTPWNGTSDALRYMDNPAADGTSRDHYSTRYTGTADNGGVHWNSGIANLAFTLVAEGGSHPNPARSVTSVEGIGLTKAGRIWYRGLTRYMTSTTNFAGARAALWNAATDLYGAGSPEAAAVANAWAEVGVGSPVTAPTPNPSPAPTPTPGDGNATNLSAPAGSQLGFTVAVPAGATELRVAIQGGTGDADLYVRHGAEPTTTTWDCRPYKSGNVEECVIADPAEGVWHLGVRAWSAFTGVDLSTTITAPPPAPPEFLDETGLSGAQGAELRYTLDVPAGAATLTFAIRGGTGDADLYVRHGDAPTQTTWDCRPYRAGNDELCAIDAPAAGPWHVLVRGYSAFAGVDLEGAWE